LSVSIRTREIAIRVALGADPQRIVAATIRESAAPVLLGLVVGVLLSAGMSRLMQSLLHGTSPFDPMVYAAAALALLATSLVACLLPARRALAIDPARALRLE
jgi:ABC-type antimicrobial peptide transport system permease subunit